MWLIEGGFAERAMQQLRGVNWTAHMQEFAGGVPLQSTPYAVEDDIAYLSLSGPLMRGMSSMQEMMGGTSTVMFRRAVAQAANDPGVKGGVFEVDSPGGTVDGTPELAAAIRDFAARKPLAVYVEGLACSAGYWAASQAGHIVASRGAKLANIGGFCLLEDPTREEVNAGRDPVLIRSGRHKAIGFPGAPITDENRAMIARWMSAPVEDFFNEVAAARNLSVETIRDMEAAVFNARDALENGLIDEIGGIEQAVAWVKQQAAIVAPRAAVPVGMGAGRPQGVSMNPIQTIQAGLAALGIGAGDETAPEPTAAATLTTATATLQEHPLLAACREQGITGPAALKALAANAALGEQYTAAVRAEAKAEYIRAVGQDKADPERLAAFDTASFADAKALRDTWAETADAKFGAKAKVTPPVMGEPVKVHDLTGSQPIAVESPNAIYARRAEQAAGNGKGA